MLKKPTIWAEIGEIDGFIAIFYSSKMKWKSNFSKSLNSSNLSWFNWIVFWILHSKRLQKTCILQNCKKNHELHTLNMLWGVFNNKLVYLYQASMNGMPSFWLTKLIFLLQNSEASLPVCSPNSVCNKVDTYGSPWVEKQCRCPSSMDSCSSATHSKDGHTISDRNRQYKVSFFEKDI